jgi:transposase-like protein
LGKVVSLINKAIKMTDNFKDLIELTDYFKEEKTCHEFLAHQIWEGGKPVCPFCNSTKVYITKSRSTKPSKKDVPEYRCASKECGRKFSVTKGTIFESSKVHLRTWYAAIYLITTHKKGISSLQLAEDLKVTQKTAWFINHRIREMYKETAPEMLCDVVQLDETLVGGKNKNRHANKKVPNSQGRSGKDKTTVFGARSLSGKVRTQVIPDVEADTIKPIVEKWVRPGSIMVTDSWKSYKALNQDYFHVVINHTEGEYARGGFSSNGIENFWSLFKRGIIGIYHQVSPKHLHRYSTEFAYRYNTRKENAGERFTNTIKNANTARLKYKDLIADQNTEAPE